MQSLFRVERCKPLCAAGRLGKESLISIKESEVLAVQRLVSTLKPQADRCAAIETSLDEAEKQQRRYVALLNGLRGRLETAETDAHTLRTEKAALSQKVLDQQRKLEALKRLSLSAQAGGTATAEVDFLHRILRSCVQLLKAFPTHALDARQTAGLVRGSLCTPVFAGMSVAWGVPLHFQIEALRAIIWKQQLELQQLHLKSAEAVDSAASTGGFFRKLEHQQQQQLLLLAQQQQRQKQQDGAAAAEGKTSAEGLRLVEEFQAFETALLRHCFAVPLWEPSASPEENKHRMQRYKAEHDALCMQASALSKKMERHVSGLCVDSCLAAMRRDVMPLLYPLLLLMRLLSGL
ncbi:hypothetical protein cyc_03364 [Cyclospora cayetanensis]|uniref:Uncharacterized protein n=1 Tax=Cyclospora cayetanensis TaxID=88456 RepID=A0A1D3CUY9_9EIME|nr:hypothetical protein cyc_03364 [Cyclospora cayetanensis]